MIRPIVHHLCAPGDSVEPDYFAPPFHLKPVLNVIAYYKGFAPMLFARTAIGEPWIRQ